MIKKYLYDELGQAQMGWLHAHYHFSFANYYNPARLGIGNLIVINDDLIKGHGGFSTHPHNDMEIVTYIINGELTHQDSMGNIRSLKRGEVQYMSAGTGVTHSEYNDGDETLRLLQIWVKPDKIGYNPNYGEHLFKWEDRIDNFLNIVSSYENDAAIKVHQDFNIYVNYATKDTSFALKPNKVGYLICIEGDVDINGTQLGLGDAIEFNEDLNIKINEDAHLIVFEVEA